MPDRLRFLSTGATDRQKVLARRRAGRAYRRGKLLIRHAKKRRAKRLL